ncbi:MAG: iron uptake porin [Kaiparowitsia implicata GSE-PSE-MK54-09C]|nr:iron uptake porin [Kaiparowitsia implicata GSE-PSE-MK54-09C]
MPRRLQLRRCFCWGTGLVLGWVGGAPTSLIQAAPLPPIESAQPPMAQTTVPSVTQFSDVQPTDWAYEALRLLVERDGCLSGYPDGTFRGDRPMSRDEFAASLSACLAQLQDRDDGSVGDDVLSAVQRLQREFAAELARVGDRLNTLDGRTAALTQQQFSTTTRLYGEAILGLSATVGDQIAAASSDNLVLQHRTRLTLRTSFTGSDALNARLTAGNGLPPVTPASLLPGVTQGTAEGRLSASVGGNTSNRLDLDRLDYSLPLGDRTQLYIAGVGGRSSDYLPSTANPYFDDGDGGMGAISAFAQQNPIYRIGGGSGAGVTVEMGDRLFLSAGYLASRANQPGESQGLFEGDFAALAQVTVVPSDAIQLGLTYVRGYHTSGNSIFALGSQEEFFTGTVPANALHTGLDVSATTNSVGGSLSLQLSPGLAVNAFGGYTDLNLLNNTGSGEIWYYGLGLAFPDLFAEGNLGGLVVGAEPYLGGATAAGLNLPQLGLSNDTSLHLEAFYRYALSDRLMLTPGIIWITAPDQFRGNDDYVVGTLRMTLRF